jgi:hypothetical protein
LTPKGRFLFRIEFFSHSICAQNGKNCGTTPAKTSPGVPSGRHSELAGQGDTGKVVSRKKILTIFTFFT